jgi:hypothetical protein
MKATGNNEKEVDSVDWHGILCCSIISIAFYSKASILRNVESGKNDISNSIARTIRAQEMHNLHAFSMNGNGDYSNAIASAIDTKRRDSIE